MLIRSNLSSNAMVLGLVIAVVLPVRLALKPQYAAERRKIENQGRQERTRELAAHWNALPYTDAVSGDLTEALLAKIDWPSLSVSEPQKAKLRQRLRESFNYLQNPTFEEYYRLKTEGFHWKLRLSNLAPMSLRRLASSSESTNEPAPRELVRSFWEAINTRKSGVPPRIIAICMDHIGTETSHTNSPHAVMGEKVSKGFTMARSAIDPGFQYGASDKPPLMHSNLDLFVHFSFFVRSNVSDDAGPVYLSLYWSEPDQNWALSRMFTDVLLNMDIFF